MSSALSFWIFLSLVGLQRLSELAVSARNAAWMRARGGREFGKGHFKWVVLLTVGLFAGIVAERIYFQTVPPPWWPALLAIFLAAQGLRYWAMACLGRHWNVRIWVIPGEERIAKGPYRWIAHPNYVAVFLEFAALPSLFGCYRTAVLAVAGYLWFLKVRLAEENRALALLKSG
jgi:methyltransferase